MKRTWNFTRLPVRTHPCYFFCTRPWTGRPQCRLTMKCYLLLRQFHTLSVRTARDDEDQLTCDQTLPWFHIPANWGLLFPLMSSSLAHQSPQNNNKLLYSLHYSSVHYDYFWCLFNRPIFPELLQVRPDPPKANFWENCWSIGLGLFTSQMPFMSPKPIRHQKALKGMYCLRFCYYFHFSRELGFRERPQI